MARRKPEQNDGHLSLFIKRKPFDLIKSGQKKVEYRELKDYYDQRFFEMRDFTIACDEVDDCMKPRPKKIRTLTLINGQRKDAPRITVEVDHIAVVNRFNEEELPDGRVKVSIAEETDLRDLRDVNDLMHGIEYAIHIKRVVSEG